MSVPQRTKKHGTPGNTTVAPEELDSTEARTYRNRRIGVVSAGLAAAALIGGTIHNAASNDSEPSAEAAVVAEANGKIEVSQDNIDQVAKSEVHWGTLTVREGTTLRTSPYINNVKHDGTDFKGNRYFEDGIPSSVEVTNPIVVRDLDNTWYGFTILDPNEPGPKPDMVYVKSTTGGQFDEAGRPLTYFEPAPDDALPQRGPTTPEFGPDGLLLDNGNPVAYVSGFLNE